MEDELVGPTGPGEPEWQSDTEFYLIQVNRFDRNDILLDKQYFAIIVDEESDGRYISSSVATPTVRD